MSDTVHVFVGSFSSRDAACLYSEAQWEPEPDETVSDEEYEAWEERNPSWALRNDLDVYLDSDFIETIYGTERYSYLATLLVDQKAIEDNKKMAAENANTLVLISKNALGGFPATMKSTERLTYCGEYARRRP
jgi:hypothetical protein